MTDHARVRGGGDRIFLECSRCGSAVTMLLPIRMSDSGALMKAFGDRHAECEPSVFDLSLSSMTGSAGPDGAGQVAFGFSACEAEPAPAPEAAEARAEQAKAGSEKPEPPA